MFNNDADMITKVWMLLDIVHKASTAGPAFGKWAEAARQELEQTVAMIAPASSGEPELPLEGDGEEEEEETNG